MKQIELSCKIGSEITQAEVVAAAARALGVSQKAVGECRLMRRSIDARKDLLYRCRYEVYTKDEIAPAFELEPYRDVTSSEPVIVIGAGPAGLFAALKLLMRGLKPVILERGKDVHGRKFDVAALVRDGKLNPDSNYCFGEGGAGTFSDGKLFTRSNKRGDIREVLYQLVSFGASESILTDAHPHIGTDKLPEIMENIRHCICAHGGEYHFSTKVVDIVRRGDGSIDVVTVASDNSRIARNINDMATEGNIVTADGNSTEGNCGDGVTVFNARNVILAAGHSAKEIYDIFERNEWAMEAKGFAMGVRAEHPQSLINKIQYHGKYQQGMPAAEYSFVTQIEGRGVFSFCMCPGGILVPSSTSDGELVLNGMSNSQRNSKWANAGVVVSVEPEDVPDYSKYGALSMLRFQEDVEKRMFGWTSGALSRTARHPFAAPGQRMMDFCRREVSAGLPESSYKPGVISAPLHELLPENVSLRLKYALPSVGDRLMRGYYTNDALLLGVESRTSSPVRLPRDPETLQHLTVPGLYPCGEGAGYAGGIVSSAMDGINCAAAVSLAVSMAVSSAVSSAM